MRARRGRVITLFVPACTAITLGGCAHLPRWVPFARAASDSALDNAAGAAASPEAGRVTLAASTITAEAVRDRVRSLASSGSVAYIAAELHALGLEPAGDSGTFVQRLPADRVAARAGAASDGGSGTDSEMTGAPRAAQPAAAIGPGSVSLRASGAQGSDAPVFGRDFFVVSMPAASASAPLVWAGVATPGRRMPGPEAEGRALAFYLPGAAADRTWRAALSTAVQGSVDAGATAVLLVLDPEFSDATIATLAARTRRDRAMALVVGLRYDAAHRIFRNGLRDLDQLRNAPNQLVPVSGTTITWDAAAAHAGDVADEAPGNVVAMLPGGDPVLKDTYVVFSAPIAVGGAPSAAAALLEAAEAFASLPARPARSLIFLGTAGNGAGRLGSEHFAASPPVPAERIVASISIGSDVENATDTIAAVGQHYTSMGPLVQQLAHAHPELNLTIAPDLSPEDDRFLRGDSFSFARIGVPAISFTAAPPRAASDTAAEVMAPHPTIDEDAAARLARIARFIFYFGHTLASRAERPIWTAEGRVVVQKKE